MDYQIEVWMVRKGAELPETALVTVKLSKGIEESKTTELAKAVRKAIIDTLDGWSEDDDYMELTLTGELYDGTKGMEAEHAKEN